MTAWAWKKIGDPRIDDQMRDLQGALAAKSLPVHAAILTEDATVTTLATVDIPVNTVLLIKGVVVARRTGGTSGSTNDGAGYEVTFLATNTGGTAALIGAGIVTVIGESQPGWNCTLLASGADVLVQVTGAANNDVTWKWSLRSLSVVE
jgi:hypothetical protein